MNRKQYRNKLNRKLWALAGKLGMDSETLHDIVFAITRQEHISKLTPSQLKACCQTLDDQFRQRRRGQLSYKQQKKIEGLEENLGWRGEPNRLRGFCKRVTGLEGYLELDSRNATKLIIALGNMLGWQQKRDLQNAV